MSVDFWDLLLLDRPTNSSDVVTSTLGQKSPHDQASPV
jgi:hypothetical protein